MPDSGTKQRVGTDRPLASEVDIFGLTHPGKVRDLNADHFLIASLHKLLKVHHSSLPRDSFTDRVSGAWVHIFLVADGVGAGPGGPAASSRTVEAIAEYVIRSMDTYYELDPGDEEHLIDKLSRSVRHSHEVVLGAAGREELASMATTLTMVAIRWPRAYMVHVGDSRCYRLRDGRLELMSRDQTMAQDLVDAGALDPETAQKSPLAHVLVSAVGGQEPKPYVHVEDCRREDVMLLCSDGLTKHVTEKEIGEILDRHRSAEDGCRRLVDLAIERGGSDNVTVVIGRVRSGDGDQST